MEDDKFFEIRETLCSLIRAFKDECEKCGLDNDEEISTILDELDAE